MCQTAHLEILEVSVTAFELPFKIVSLGYDLAHCIRGCFVMNMHTECSCRASVSILWSVWFKNLSVSFLNWPLKASQGVARQTKEAA